MFFSSCAAAASSPIPAPAAPTDAAPTGSVPGTLRAPQVTPLCCNVIERGKTNCLQPSTTRLGTSEEPRRLLSAWAWEPGQCPQRGSADEEAAETQGFPSPGWLLPIAASSAVGAPQRVPVPWHRAAGHPCEPFPSARHHSSPAPACGARRHGRDLLHNPGQEASLAACPSGLEQTLEKSSSSGLQAVPTLKNSLQPPLNPSAGEASLSPAPTGAG